MSKKRIFIVDDDPKIGELFATVLNRDGYNATSFTSATTVLDEIDDGKVPDVILADLHMPDITGIKLLDELRDRNLALPVIIITAQSSVTTAVEAMRLGAFHYLSKPVNLEEMRALLAKALEQEPTVWGYTMLGTIERQVGNLDAALRHVVATPVSRAAYSPDTASDGI